MKCENAELYMDALLDNELEVSDSIEIVEHLEYCTNCKKKWELNEGTRSKLKHYISNVKASKKLKQKIKETLYIKRPTLKSSYIAACMIFLLGLGFVYNESFSKVPPLNELYYKSQVQIISNKIDSISRYIGESLTEKDIISLKNESFNVVGARKIGSFYSKKGSLISFKDKNGYRISVCFLPSNYTMPECHETSENGVVYHCGFIGDCHYVYWKQGKKTIAITSDKFSSEKLIKITESLAYYQ